MIVDEGDTNRKMVGSQLDINAPRNRQCQVGRDEADVQRGGSLVVTRETCMRVLIEDIKVRLFDLVNQVFAPIIAQG